jgi:glycosyltransferase involved in cell wall biosynthesis
LKILHVIPSVSQKHGGPTYAIKAIAKASQQIGMQVLVATTDDDGDDSRLDVPLGRPVEREGVTYLFFRRNFVPYKISFGLWHWLNKHARDFDIIHIHALFSFSTMVAARIARRRGIPYVVRPLGVLNRWGLENRRPFLKRLSLAFVELPILRRAAAVHYTTKSEQRQAELVVHRPGVGYATVIPLPVRVELRNGETKRSNFFAKFPTAKDKRVILFLSRIHPKKGIELLLNAFKGVRVQRDDVILVVAGDGDPRYVSELRQRAAEMNLSESIIWTGFLDGEDKWEAFHAADIFVLPSYSENFGIVVAEAMTCSIPVIVTEGVGLAEDIAAANAGIVTKASAQEIAHVLVELLDDHDKQCTLAKNGRQFAEAQFSPASVALLLQSLYHMIVTNRETRAVRP